MRQKNANTHEENEKVKNANTHDRVTIREWLAYRIQMRSFVAKTLLSSRRLFQEFLVDGFTMMEVEKLKWLRKKSNKAQSLKIQKS